MPSTHPILSLSFSRNRLAYAVFGRGRLEYFAGKTLRQYKAVRDRNRAVKAFLSALIFAHAINSIVLPRLNKQQRRSRELVSLHTSVQRYCIKNGLMLLIQDPVQARRLLVGRARPSKANARHYLIHAFPELRRYARDESEWERRYYGHVYTAITCGLAAIIHRDSSRGEPHYV